ncbi:hypothetical protein [Clostridium baratii]|uniref:hypothetical protein n=1 Tax=Clostridium baratii TaxID=1561 RepID=UPI0030D5D029
MVRNTLPKEIIDIENLKIENKTLSEENSVLKEQLLKAKNIIEKNKPYSFVEDIKERDRIHAGLINLISRYAIDNGMTLKEIDKCME